MPTHAKFERVKGYATHAAAQKRGEEVAAARPNVDYRWVVISLPNGRFAPMAILNQNVPTGPGMFLGERNFCMSN